MSNNTNDDNLPTLNNSMSNLNIQDNTREYEIEELDESQSVPLNNQDNNQQGAVSGSTSNNDPQQRAFSFAVSNNHPQPPGLSFGMATPVTKVQLTGAFGAPNNSQPIGILGFSVPVSKVQQTGAFGIPNNSQQTGGLGMGIPVTKMQAMCGGGFGPQSSNPSGNPWTNTNRSSNCCNIPPNNQNNNNYPFGLNTQTYYTYNPQTGYTPVKLPVNNNLNEDIYSELSKLRSVISEQIKTIDKLFEIIAKSKNN